MSEMNKLFHRLLSNNIIHFDEDANLHKPSKDYKIYYKDEYEIKFFELHDDIIDMFDEDGFQLLDENLDGNIFLGNVTDISIYHKILI